MNIPLDPVPEVALITDVVPVAGDVAAQILRLSTALADRDATLVTMVRRVRHTTHMLLFSLALDILLTIGVAWIAEANHSQSSQQIVTLCQAKNDSRAQSQAIWDKLLSSVPKSPIVTQIRAEVAAADVQLSCAPGGSGLGE